VTDQNLDELSQIARTTLLQNIQTQAGIESVLENGAIRLNLNDSPLLMVRVLEVA